jgi:glutamyl-tRNA synthetase
MNSSEIRTRLAPSPTGEFHIGTLRTLLFNYAWAKKNNGKFLLRIEDTDRNRYVEGALNRILEAINAYGLDWDEGPKVGGPYGPYIQSERLNIYNEYIQRLLEKGHAYYCFCSESRLDELRKNFQEENRTFKYDKHCLSLNKSVIDEKLKNNEPYTVRLNVPSNQNIEYIDFVLGPVSFPSNDVDDSVLLKSDGYPTYHFAVVVDDHLMKITHVMRGNEWISSTPKHILLYRFFGFEEPVFAHLPNLKFVGSDKKMSKRDGSTNAMDFLKKGYLPEAILNLLMFLGWNPGTEKEFYSLQEFIKDFDINRIQTSSLVALDFQKLNWFNNQYIQKYSDSDFLELLKNWSLKNNVPSSIFELEKKYTNDNILKIIKLTKERLNLLSEFDLVVDYYIKSPVVDSISLGKYSSDPLKVLNFFKEVIENQEDFSFESLDRNLHDIVKQNSYSMKEYFMTLRIAVTGETITPPIIDIVHILGKQELLSRINFAISQLKI